MRPVAFLDVTLGPLRTEGPDSLDTTGIAGLEAVRLEELRVEWEDEGSQVLTRQAENLYDVREAVPVTGTLRYAIFSFRFAGYARPGLVKIQPPDTIFVDTSCDLTLVARWVLKHRFARGIAT